MREQVLDTWLERILPRSRDRHEGGAYRHAGVPVIGAGIGATPPSRATRCGPWFSSACRPALHELVERLLHWQWPDGGWNCDREPAADTSSFFETLLPMRALWAYASATGDDVARAAAARCSSRGSVPAAIATVE